jgi:hypothetical protein
MALFYLTSSSPATMITWLACGAAAAILDRKNLPVESA